MQIAAITTFYGNSNLNSSFFLFKSVHYSRETPPTTPAELDLQTSDQF